MIRHSRPTVGAPDLKIMRDPLISGDHAAGDAVGKFEAAVSSFIGARTHGVATSSGTSALHIALLSIGVKAGDEVIIPSYVCTAVLNAVYHAGAKPVLADIGEDGFNISYKSAARRMTKRTRAAVIPHMFGLPADIKPFLASGLCVIEDCAQALGAGSDGNRTGSKGHVSVFSFYATKLISTGHGGMLVSNTKRIAERARDLVDFDERIDYKIRFNYGMSGFQAALGTAQLSRLDEFIKKRAKIAAYYNKRFAGLPVTLPSNNGNIYYRYVVRAGAAPDIFISELKKRGIEAKRPVFKPLHRYLGLNNADFPVTEKAFSESVSLPIYPSLTEKEGEKVADVFAGAVRRNIC